MVNWQESNQVLKAIEYIAQGVKMKENKRTMVVVPLRVYVDVEVDVLWITENEEVQIEELRLPLMGGIHTAVDSLSMDDLEAIDNAVMDKLGVTS